MGGDLSADEQKRLTALIVRESERVDRLVAQLLRFAKPTAVERVPLDVSTLLHDCAEALRSRTDFQNAKIDLRLNIAGGLTAKGNYDEIKEVFNNLMVNAVQAVADDRISERHRLSVTGQMADGGCECMIEDNGPGISSDNRGRVFDPFFTTKSEGTGLGLAQVYKIVKDHGGEVELDSGEGRGTRVTVRLFS